MMDTHFLVLAAGGGIDDFVQAAAGSPEVSYFLVEAPEGIVGYLPRNSVLELSRRPDSARRWPTWRTPGSSS